MPYANLTFKTLFSNALQKPETLCRFRIPDLSLVFSIALTEFSDDDEFLPPPCICSAPYVCIKYINYIVARFNVRSKQRLLCFTSFVQSQFQTLWPLRCKKSEIQGILLCCSSSYTFTSKNQFYHITILSYLLLVKSTTTRQPQI